MFRTLQNSDKNLRYYAPICKVLNLRRSFLYHLINQDDLGYILNILNYSKKKETIHVSVTG